MQGFHDAFAGDWRFHTYFFPQLLLRKTTSQMEEGRKIFFGKASEFLADYDPPGRAVGNCCGLCWGGGPLDTQGRAWKRLPAFHS